MKSEVRDNGTRRRKRRKVVWVGNLQKCSLASPVQEEKGPISEIRWRINARRWKARTGRKKERKKRKRGVRYGRRRSPQISPRLPYSRKGKGTLSEIRWRMNAENHGDESRLPAHKWTAVRIGLSAGTRPLPRRDKPRERGMVSSKSYYRFSLFPFLADFLTETTFKTKILKYTGDICFQGEGLPSGVVCFTGTSKIQRHRLKNSANMTLRGLYSTGNNEDTGRRKVYF